MTREEAKAEINKIFEPAFANYIITALTEGATPSERKTGKWIRPKRSLWHMADCSICGEVSMDIGKFCPHCGAKMEEG